jgi:hypothetical protein
MSESRDLPSIVEAAERAAEAGDYASAESHLRAAIAVQEATLGPGHPDLANTLNNLGVVSERAGHSAEAEHSYRRAYAVARAALAPDHPFVVTSARNLREFCEAFGRPFELPTPPSTAASPVERPARTPAPAPARPSPGESRRPIALPALAMLGAAGLVLVWFVVNGAFRRRADVARSATNPTTAAAELPTPAAPSAPAAVSPPAATSPPAAANPPGRKAVEPPRALATSRPGSRISPPGPAGRTADVAATSIRVGRAQICRRFSTLASNGPDWRCDPVNGSASTGTLFFYTRLASPKPTNVLHRWYRGDSLLQEVELRVDASPSPGYRTFSRLTIGPERAGDWRVELRTTDGTLLHTEAFVVR